MGSLFTSKFFAGNRQRLREQLAVDAPIVITANGLLQRSGDSGFAFKQDANFWYLTGLDDADMVLVMDSKTDYVIMPLRSRVQDLFDGTVNQTELKKISGISEFLTAKDGWKRLEAQLIRTNAVCTLEANPAYIRLIGMYSNPARARLIQKLKRQRPGLRLKYIGEILADLRVVKQQPEIEAIRKAVDITCQAFAEARKGSFGHEYQLEAEITRQFRNRGASGHAYDPIVAAAKNACTLHYINNSSPINKSDIVLIDAGAEYEHYIADITRSWVTGKPTARQKAVIMAVGEVLEAGTELLKPGVSFADCEQEIRRLIAKKLKDLKLINSVDDIEGVRRYYPHAPHYIGLNVHDVGDYRQPLKPGMTLTLEPGIYIPEEGIGVRIEDDILITDKGAEVLSARLPRVLN